MKKYRTKTALVVLSIFFASQCHAEKSFNERFSEFMKEASSLKDISLQKAAEHKIEDNIKNYTTNPEQTVHYKEENLDTIEMEQKAAKESVPDAEESPCENAGKIVTGSFKKRMVYKFDKNDPDVSKAKDIEASPEKHAKVTFDTRASCQKKKTLRCEETLSEKRCEEQVRALAKVCAKVPKIVTSVREVVYPGCQNIIVTKGARNGCPVGYSTILYADMIQYVDWDDVRLCTKAAPAGESSECFGGYMVHELNQHRLLSTERTTVPKKLQGRIRFSNVYWGKVRVTIVNETTGEPVRNNESFSDGQVINLPYSDTQDQTFRFYTEKQGGGWFGWHSGVGVMVLSFDHMYRETIATLESWQETNCSDI
jgi:hypothetical protein